MDYKKNYEDALEVAKELIDQHRQVVLAIFPELKEEKDNEDIKKELIDLVQAAWDDDVEDFSYDKKIAWINWLKKQGEGRKQLYVRFGDIPVDEKSKIYRGEEEIGEEDGVSVYPAFELNGNVVLGLTLPITSTTLYTQQHLLEYDNRPCYLVSGDYVGNGKDGEPLLKNVSIIRKLDNYRVKELEKQGEQKTTIDSSNLRTWKYIVDAVLTEKEGIGQYLDSSVTEEIAKKLQERFGNIDQKPIKDIPSKEVIYSIWDLGNRWKEITKGRITEKYGTQLDYIQKHWQESDYYRKQVEESASPTKPVREESLDDNTKAESKFKVKDWIITPENKILQVTGIDGDSYVFNNGLGDCYYWTTRYCDTECHLWSFREDAKNGDIITCENGWTCIFKEWIDDETFSSYCYIDETGWVRKTESEEYHTLRRDCIRAYNGKFSPVLRKKAAHFKDEISQAGYIWDSKKKQLIKI